MKRTILVFLVLLIPCFSLTGQTPAPKQDKPYVLSVDVDLVLLNVNVMDKKGNVVRGLEEKNFKVFEDGVPQEIREFHPEDIPATVGLVIDNSGSMWNKKTEVIQAAIRFVKDSHPQDELFIVNFSDDVRMGLPPNVAFSSSYQQLRDALLLTESDGRTALYDALGRALHHLESGTRQRKALVVLSDGGDNMSVSSLDDVLRLAQSSSATIYTIGIYDESDPYKNPKVLSRLAKITGGESYIPRDTRRFEHVWTRIAGGIRTQYTVGYVSTNPARDGNFRNVKIMVADNNGKPLRVRTRTGYLVAP